MEETSKTFKSSESQWKVLAEQAEFIEKRKYVPEEFENGFQAMRISGGLFGGGGLDYAAVCLKCGAMVYPSAIDRHSRFHESQAIQNLESPK